ncbi:MAG: hypothetical protein JO057_11370 [Chloroflexi bacterium]|nr:hypothetical protein [Chloroflexota bacterium]
MLHWRSVALATLANILAIGSSVAMPWAAAQPQVAPPPTLTLLPTTDTSHAWLGQAPLADGYVEEEYQYSGTAGLYTYDGTPPAQWGVTLKDEQPYTTRMIVRRPTDPQHFNGVVAVEWLNVTAGYDVDIEWTRMADYFTRAGYAFVGVSAQQVGVEALKKWDPTRYGNLNILDDGQSYDIFTQAAQAIREPNSPLMGGLPVQQVIGTGVSQSAWRLVPYINSFQSTAHVYDGFFVHSRGNGTPPIQGIGINSDNQADPILESVGVPVLLFQTEGDLLALNYAAARQDDSDHIRTWELPGAPHVGAGTSVDTAIANGVRARDTGTAAGLFNPVCPPDPFPAWPVADAGWEHLHEWIAGGDAPATAPRIQLTGPASPLPPPPGFSNSLIARDDMGNALGGIRTPALDAPIGAYYGSSPCNPGRLGYLAGLLVPFDAATQNKLYPTHDAYVDKVTASAQKAVSDGFMLPEDATTLINEAMANTIGSLGATVKP